MKKFSAILILSALVLPTFAEEAKVSDHAISTDQGTATVVEQYSKQFEQTTIKMSENKSNPKTRFPQGLQLGFGVSTTSGLNAFVGYNNKNFDSFWAKRFGIRFDFASYSPIKSRVNKVINNVIGDDGLKMSDTVKLQDFKIDGYHYGAIVDFYPFGNVRFLGEWRLSGGYVIGKTNVNAAPWSERLDSGLIRFYLDDWMLFYNGGQMLARGNVNWKYSGPYLGTGFDLGIFAGFKMFVDAGLVFADKTPDVTLNVPLEGLMRIEEITPGNKQLVFVKDNENAYNNFKTGYDAALASARKEVKDYKYYPMLKIGFMYRF